MAIIWAGTSIADGITGVVGTPSQSSTIASVIPTALVKEGVSIGNFNSSSKLNIPPATDIWFGFHSRMTTVTNNGSPPGTRVRSAGGVSLMGVRPISTSAMQAFVADTVSTVTQVGTFLPVNSGLSRYDIHFKLHASDGELAVYQNGNELFKFNGQTDYLGLSFADILLGGWRDSNSEYSAMIVADEDTRPLLMHQVLPNANGGVQQWTGDYTAIDEIGFNDADALVSGNVNQKSLFGFPAQGAATAGRSVESVILSLRGMGAGTQAIRGVARPLSTDFEKLSETDVLPNYSGLQYRFPVNPATGEPWTLAEINAAQFGVRSA